MKPWLVQYGHWRDTYEAKYDLGSIDDRVDRIQSLEDDGVATDTELPWKLLGDVMEANIRGKWAGDAVKLENKNKGGKKGKKGKKKEKAEPKNKKRKVDPAPVRSSARQKAAQASVSQSQSDAPAAPE